MEELRQETSDEDILHLSEYGGKKWAKLSDSEGKGELVDAHEGDRHRRTQLLDYLEDHGTTSLSIIDKDRNAVSMTSTINTYFGSKVVSPSTGIVFNSQMDDFAKPGKIDFYGLEPSESNFIVPGKCPLSSMSPTLVFHGEHRPGIGKKSNLGKIFMALGASGGPKIISSVSQVFQNHAIQGLPLFESMAHARIHCQSFSVVSSK